MKKFFFIFPTAILLVLFTVSIGFTQYDPSGSAPSSAESVSSRTPISENSAYQWEFDTSLTYSTGDFGTSKTTNTLYWPFTLKRLFELGNVFLTIPAIHQDSGSGVTSLGGRPFQTNRTTLGSNKKETGIGDVLLGGEYYLLKELI